MYIMYSVPIVSAVQCGLVLINGHCHHRHNHLAEPPNLKQEVCEEKVAEKARHIKT